MKIIKCPSYSNGTCVSSSTSSLECEKNKNCILKEIIYFCQKADMDNKSIKPDEVMRFFME